jgi:hypothetical protein
MKGLSVSQAEKKLNLPFPSELQEFYSEIGSGFLAGGNKPSSDGRYFIDNHILAPSQIVDLTLNGPESGMVKEAMWELFEPEKLYFFDVCEGYFLHMRPLSDTPNAVYDMSDVLVESSLERFIWRLYHEAPNYYMKDWGQP